jgi:hypothetical protein
MADLAALKPGSLYLGSFLDPATGKPGAEAVFYDARDFTTHGVIVGMTGSGKTGLGIVVLEEALLTGVPVLAIDPKGDLTNMLLNFPDFRPADFEPWVNPGDAQRAGQSVADFAAGQAQTWQQGLAGAGITPERMRRLKEHSRMTIYTPGSTSGVPMNIVGSLRRPPVNWATDAESARDEIEGFVTSLLGLAGIPSDPITSREHILLSNLIENAWSQGQDLDVATLLAQVQKPPLRKLGVFELDAFYPEKERLALAMRLNGLFAAPSFAAWMEGPALDVGAMLAGEDGRPGCAIVYLAHLSDEERQFIVPLIMAKVVTWFRSQPGTTDLRALVYMDEVYGFVPPSANPPAKKPILTIFKQARAFGVGMVLSTQNPVDLDYKAISNAGTWLIGRLQTEQDKARLMDGLQAVAGGVDVGALNQQIAGLGKRQFLLNKAGGGAPRLFTSRWAISYLRGPLTKDQISLLMKDTVAQVAAVAAASAPARGAASPAPAAGGAAAAATAPAAGLAANETPVAPAVAAGVPVYYLDPAAPWARDLGVSAAGKRMAAAVVARVHVTYTDATADVDEREEWEAVFYPLERNLDAAKARTVDYDDRDLHPAAPLGVVYVLPDAPIDKPAYFKAAEQDIRAALARVQKLDVFRNRTLKLFARPGESRADFDKRCVAAAEDKADEETAKIRDRLETKLDRLKDAIDADQRKVAELERTEAAKKQEMLLGTAGSVLGSLFGGRGRNSQLASIARGLNTFSGKQARASQVGARLDAAKAELADTTTEASQLEAEIGQEVQQIHDKWLQVAADVDVFTVTPKKTGLDVDEVALVWLPMP